MCVGQCSQFLALGFPRGLALCTSKTSRRIAWPSRSSPPSGRPAPNNTFGLVVHRKSFPLFSGRSTYMDAKIPMHSQYARDPYVLPRQADVGDNASLVYRIDLSFGTPFRQGCVWSETSTASRRTMPPRAAHHGGRPLIATLKDPLPPSRCRKHGPWFRTVE